MDQICPKWIKLDQTWSNLIKLDQIGFPHQSKNVTIKSCHIYRKDKNGCFVFDFLGSDLSKMDQTCITWISQLSKSKNVNNFIWVHTLINLSYSIITLALQVNVKKHVHIFYGPKLTYTGFMIPNCTFGPAQLQAKKMQILLQTANIYCSRAFESYCYFLLQCTFP